MHLLLYKLCSLSFSEGLQGYLLPCPFKYFTGIDCPGCGFQRAMLALFRGDWHASFAFYPATIPLLLAIAYTLADNLFKLDTPGKAVKKTSYIIVASIMLVSYTIKMVHLCPL